MKKIGIILRDNYNIECRKAKTINNEIYDYLDDYIVIGICVSFNNDSNQEFLKIKQIIDICDGIILQGGDTLYPIDLKICKYLYNNDIPTLGICLGMQIMGICLNGELSVSHLINHMSNKKYVHNVTVNTNSKLYDILGQNKIEVNSRHKDYLIKTDLSISCYSDDNIIEAIEDKNKRFFIGVQWHPESIKDEFSNRIFNNFLSSL